ncbi:inositol-pentakisphosphate 2-kinase [Apodospora peruviana]|uniref:Inositol-pentakisphosphate 2-kinase n=1 Tax=Apodospora peruviana TaxID=516989 RepID=A0AAE0M7V1_9PEZI|nr:inositol-pentakisphosphate 2-kinase [Apodospora peruviana]
MSTSVSDLASLAGTDSIFKFVGEGAANIVFEIIQPASSQNDILRGKLLRVPKARTHALNYEELQCYWETAIKPLFRDGELVEQSLVRIGAGRHVLSDLNSVLAEFETTRRRDFQGSRVDEEAEYGMLVDDMRKKNPDDTVLEFKPKWIFQSPNAPFNAKRCRNCAKATLRASDSRRSDGVVNGGGGTPPPSYITDSPVLCSIDVLESKLNHRARDRVLAIITENLLQPADPRFDRLKAWLELNHLLPRLCNLQRVNDDVFAGGCLEADPAQQHPKLELAMTLRDCTCFVRIPADPTEEVEAKLADLDKKNGAAKLRTWQALERRLVEEGFYTAPKPREQWTCRLERGREDHEE